VHPVRKVKPTLMLQRCVYIKAKKEMILHPHQTAAHQRTPESIGWCASMTKGKEKEKRCPGHTAVMGFPAPRHNSQVSDSIDT
jgi:hypothetical protein